MSYATEDQLHPTLRSHANKPLRIVPTDEECGAAWDAIMEIAERHCLITMAFGGVACLAVPREQREAGIRENVLTTHCATEDRG